MCLRNNPIEGLIHFGPDDEPRGLGNGHDGHGKRFVGNGLAWIHEAFHHHAVNRRADKSVLVVVLGLRQSGPRQLHIGTRCGHVFRAGRGDDKLIALPR